MDFYCARCASKDTHRISSPSCHNHFIMDIVFCAWSVSPVWSKMCPLCRLWGGFQTIHWQRRVFRNHGLGNCLSRILRHLFIIIYMNCMHIYIYMYIYIYYIYIYIYYIYHLIVMPVRPGSISPCFAWRRNVGLPFAPGGLQPNWQISMQNNGDKPRVFLVSMTCLSYMLWVCSLMAQAYP